MPGGSFIAISGALSAARLQVAAFFPPWWSLGESLDAVAEAGDVIGIPTLPFVLTISGDPRHIDARLHQAGAIMVLHRALPFICSNG